MTHSEAIISCLLLTTVKAGLCSMPTRAIDGTWFARVWSSIPGGAIVDLKSRGAVRRVVSKASN